MSTRKQQSKDPKAAKPAVGKGASAGKRFFGAPLPPDTPKIITETIKHLREQALTEEGLFRISGNSDEVQQLKELWENSKEFDLNKYSPHALAGVMKMYLRELPEPLLSYQFYSAFLTTDAIAEPEARHSAMRKLFSLLPHTNCEILRVLMCFLHDMKDHVQKTKMTPANLAIVFAPNLLRTRVESVQIIMRDAPHVQSIMRDIIENFHSLFDQPFEPVRRERTVKYDDTKQAGGSEGNLHAGTAGGSSHSGAHPPPTFPSPLSATAVASAAASAATAPVSTQLTTTSMPQPSFEITNETRVAAFELLAKQLDENEKSLRASDNMTEIIPLLG